MKFIELLESRDLLSVAHVDVPPVAPSNVSATLVTVSGKKYVQLKWSDNSYNEDWFIVLSAKGKNPVGNVWKEYTRSPYLTYKYTVGRRSMNIPYVKNMSWAVQAYRNTPSGDTYRWSDMVPLRGCFVA